MAGPDQDLTLRAKLDASGVVDGAEKGKAALDGLKQKAKEPAAAFDESKAAADRLNTAVDKLNAQESPRGLIKGAAQLEAALEEIRKSAGPIGPELAASIAKAQSAIDAAIPKAGKLADAMGDMRTRATGAAEGHKLLQSSMGGLPSLFTAMDDGGKGWVSTLGKVGITSFGVVEGVKLIIQTVQAANQTIQEHLTKADAWAFKMGQVQLAHDHASLAIAAAQKGTIAYGGSLAATIANLDRYTVAHGRNTLAIEAMAKTAGVTAPTSLRAMEESTKNLDAVTSAAFARMGSNTLLWAKANESALRAAQEQARVTGDVLPPAIQKAIDLLDKQAEANTRLKQSIDELNKAYEFDLSKAGERLKATQDQIKNSKDLIAAAGDEAVAARATADAKIKALNDEALSDVEYSAKKKAIVAEMDAALEASTAKEIAGREKLKAAIAAEIAAHKDGAAGLAQEMKALEELATARTAVVEKSAIQLSVERDLAEGTGKLSQATLDLLNAEKERVATSGETTASLQAQVDAMNGLVGAQSAVRDSTLAADEATLKHRERLEALTDATKKAAESTNYAKDQFGSFKQATDLLGEALAAIT